MFVCQKLLFAFMFSVAIFLFLPKNVFAQVVINEVEYDSIQFGIDSQYEWVELFNTDDTPVTLEGWNIKDNSAADPIPTITIPGHSFFILVANEEGFRTNHPDFSGQLLVIGDGKIGNGLSNENDFLELNGTDKLSGVPE